MKFSLHHGQVKVRLHSDGEPVRMYYVPSPYRSRIEVKDVDAGVGRVVCRADADTGIAVVDKPMAIAQLYILGWPIVVAELADVTPIARPADEVALVELRKMRDFMLDAVSQSLGVPVVKGTREDQETATARAINDPWQMFGVARQYCKRVNFRSPPEGLVFPRPDKGLDGLDDDPFWSFVDEDVVTDLKSKVEEFYWPQLLERTI